ncbi:MAG TPA: TMEM165/GDT1 family protein [Pseudonocardia sp.]|jgi:putative Ca2+/H+ antiporter (TMEM165/GDT1 family)|uniref:TMEM165/GDT1 family protein n=1 Tax=Pseudonocardia sp. TaxID=60912 RepID=UPI002D18FE99|nr:TMEM165/GDT1 family protein [Pseudonocardia sp.]HTF51405.1 TMEM165/GDT1 family protein [Pseudonocardia sp.]
MGVAAITFGIVFLAELVDTSGLVTLVLGTRFPARWVLLGVCAGMLVHVAVAIAAGSLVALLPERPLEGLLAVIFLVGAVLLLREDDDDDDEPNIRKRPQTPWSVVATSFGVTALSEFADPSQLIIVTLAARYNDPLAVGIGALLGLWVVSALAVYGGNRLQRVVPLRWVTRATAAVLVVLGVLSAIDAIRG